MNSSDKFISSFEIKTFLINVTEKIDDKYLAKFCKTQLTLNDYSLGQNDFLGTVYLEESNQQFIFITKDSNKSFIFDIFYDELEKYDEEFICIVYCDVIYIFKYKKLYYFQVLDYTLQNQELKNLIDEKLNIQINKIVNLENKDLEKIEIVNLKNSIVNLNSSKKINWFRLFTLYILFLIVIASFLLHEKLNEKPIEIKKEYYTYKSKKLDEILKVLNQNNILIDNIKEDNKLKITVSIKKEFYTDDLIAVLKKSFKIITSNFDEKSSLYKVEIHAK